jgi:hypothetical protein
MRRRVKFSGDVATSMGSGSRRSACRSSSTGTAERRRSARSAGSRPPRSGSRPWWTGSAAGARLEGTGVRRRDRGPGVRAARRLPHRPTRRLATVARPVGEARHPGRPGPRRTTHTPRPCSSNRASPRVSLWRSSDTPRSSSQPVPTSTSQPASHPKPPTPWERHCGGPLQLTMQLAEGPASSGERRHRRSRAAWAGRTTMRTARRCSRVIRCQSIRPAHEQGLRDDSHR